MKQKIIKRISLFLNKISQIIGTFILTIIFLCKYIINLVWELIMMIFEHVDYENEEKKEIEKNKEIKKNHEKISYFSYIWKLLKNKNPKQVSEIIFTKAKETAQNTNKKFWIDLEKVLPILFTGLILFLLFIGLAVLDLINVFGIWIILTIGVLLYFFFLSWIKNIFKKLLK